MSLRNRRLQSTFVRPESVSDSVVYESPWLVVRKVVKAMPSGAEAAFYLRDEPDVVVCLPFTEKQTCILVEEFRHGPDRSLFEIPGGNADPGESIVKAAEREVLEETGYAGEPVHLVSTWISAYSRARKHIFLMRNARRVKEPDIADSELLRVLDVSLEDFVGVLKSGELTDLDAGLLCLEHLREGSPLRAERSPESSP